jgi:transposase
MAPRPSEEFKRDAVRIALTSGLTRKQASSDLGVGMSTLGKWIRTYRDGDVESTEEQELAKETSAFAVRTACFARRGKC